MELKYSYVLVLVVLDCVCGELCPKKCDCDQYYGMNRATCVDQNIISIEVGVPNAVQIYSLSHNMISELENFCFKEAGYLYIEVLNLSYNVIYWIGLHAFSGLDKLAHLDLSNNRLRYIPSDLFWDTPELISLDLSSNIFENDLKNEPFIMHEKLQVLNMNNCRIKSLPDRLFTRLPELRKLDISENNIITLNTKLLVPLKKLQRIELRNDYFQLRQCTSDFVAAESWIISRGITYQKQCRKKAPNMSEKMISMVPEEKEDVDVSQVWNITGTTAKNDTGPEIRATTLTPFEKFDKEFSSMQAFVIGIELGLAIGIVGTYIWLRKFCHCGQLNCIRPQTGRQRRRAQRVRETDMRTNLLWSNMISPDLDTPPSYRRHPSLPDRSPPLRTYGVPIVEAAALQVDAIRPPDRAETPPPPYNESCRIVV
ncbi:insulin-like growth factor-binding protein complex acid labile subunit [Ostrinia nubilalis]|uniref:insulin-like growth factor-binding protein complex acid labile subunit n=1 Tax=Ostrinia nubilalis TaxID=29057 RepID=UPI0030824C89